MKLTIYKDGIKSDGPIYLIGPISYSSMRLVKGKEVWSHYQLKPKKRKLNGPTRIS